MGVHQPSLPDQDADDGGSSLILVEKRWRQITTRTVQWIVVAATVVVIIRLASQQREGLNDLDLELEPLWLVHAAIATSAANLLLPLGWRCLIAAYGQFLSAGRAVRLWCLAQTARYLPTGLVAVASRLQLAAKEGIPRSVTATSIAIETLILFGWAIAACAIFVPSTVVPNMMRWLSGLIAAAGLLLAPWVIKSIGGGLSRINKVVIPSPKRRLLAQGTAFLGASVAARAVGTVALATAFLEVSPTDVPLIIGASYAAVVAGMVGITPAGLGVREGVMAAILADRFGFADAAAFALLSRAWEFSFEMAFLGAASWWGRRRPNDLAEKADSVADDGRL